MQNKTKYYIFVLIITILVSIWYFLKPESNLPKSIENTPISETQSSNAESSKDFKDINIGKMTLTIPSNLTYEKKGSLLTINIPGIYRDLNAPSQIGQTSFVNIIYGKDYNENNQNITDWFEENGPATEKTSATSEYDEVKSLNGSEYMESLYQAPTSRESSDFYDVVELNIANKSDIYQIDSFRKSINPRIILTIEEQNSIENYERIVDKIISSIKFVN